MILLGWSFPLNIIIAANSALKSSASFWNDINWQKDEISVLAAVSDKICSTLVRGVHSILISSPLESILGLCLSSSQLVFSPVVLEFQLAFLGLMNQICDLVLPSLLSCWLISFFLEMRRKSQTFSLICISFKQTKPSENGHLRCSPCWRTCGALPLLSCSLSAIAYFHSADRLLWFPRTWFLLFHDSVCPVAAETEKQKCVWVVITQKTPPLYRIVHLFCIYQAKLYINEVSIYIKYHLKKWNKIHT